MQTTCNVLFICLSVLCSFINLQGFTQHLHLIIMHQDNRMSGVLHNIYYMIVSGLRCHDINPFILFPLFSTPSLSPREQTMHVHHRSCSRSPQSSLLLASTSNDHRRHSRSLHLSHQTDPVSVPCPGVTRNVMNEHILVIIIQSYI